MIQKPCVIGHNRTLTRIDSAMQFFSCLGGDVGHIVSFTAYAMIISFCLIATVLLLVLGFQ